MYKKQNQKVRKTTQSVDDKKNKKVRKTTQSDVFDEKNKNITYFDNEQKEILCFTLLKQLAKYCFENFIYLNLNTLEGSWGNSIIFSDDVDKDGSNIQILDPEVRDYVIDILELIFSDYDIIYVDSSKGPQFSINGFPPNISLVDLCSRIDICQFIKIFPEYTTLTDKGFFIGKINKNIQQKSIFDCDQRCFTKSKISYRRSF